jgi:hypothetical protein
LLAVDINRNLFIINIATAVDESRVIFESRRKTDLKGDHAMSNDVSKIMILLPSGF